jgi:colicin import membrane protein
VFTDVISGNPKAIVRLRVAPDGTIVGRQLVASSGVKSWDDAVLRAIDRTGTIPRDTDGSVVPDFEIDFRPNE